MPQWITPSGFLFTATELQFNSVSVVATGTGVNYSVISGKIPVGLTFTNGVINGTPQGVISTQRSKFVVRASDVGGVVDRTFLIDVEGADKPEWLTASGYLPVGYNGQGYGFTNQFVNVGVSATSIQPNNLNIKYFLADGSGSLPKGLSLSQDGVISGFIEEEVTLGDPPDRFTFEVSATDGISTSSRFFRIIVIAPDYFRVDNENLNFSTTFITSFTSTFVINTGTSVFTSGTNLPSNFNLGLLNPFDLLYHNSALPQGGRIISIGTNTFSINTVTTASIAIGSTLTVYRPSTGFDILTGYAITNDVSYLQPPQFLKGTDLGIIKSNNNYAIDISAYDAAPFRGTITYSIVTGTSIYNQLPEGLILESNKGYLYGFIPYQPAYLRTYNLTVQAIKNDNSTGFQVTATNTFTLAIQGEIDSTIEWLSDNDLGTIEVGSVSELSIKAQATKSNFPIKYQISEGNLPSGLTLTRDGDISGTVNYGSTGTYLFKVIASDIYEESWIEKEFNLSVVKINNKEYTKIYIKPFFHPNKRKEYRNFITNLFTFDPNLIYRYNDPNFGIQPEIKIILEFGIEKIDLTYYVSALRENFYRKRFYFGNIKKAIAKNNKGEALYELVYVDPIDDMINDQNKSVSETIYIKDEIYYPSSIDNMKKQLRLIPLEDDSYISVDENLQPKFMTTPQENNYRIPGYIRVIPICYALPGQGDRIISRIKLSNFDFKMLNFEVDRMIVENAADQNSAKYLVFDRQYLNDEIETDNYLFGLDWALTPELTVRLDDESNNPLNRY